MLGRRHSDPRRNPHRHGSGRRRDQAHELISAEARDAAHAAAASGDDGTNALLVSDVLRRNELQVWFVFEQLAGVGLADKDREAAGSPVKAHA